MTNAEEFEAFMRNYQDMVFSTAIRLVADQAEAEDISQEVFLRAFEHFEMLQQSATPGGWLKRVAVNLSLNHLSRYRSRWRFFSELRKDQDEAEGVEPEFEAPQDLGQELAEADRHRVVEKALATLPSSQRVPLVLFHLEGMSYTEISEKLSISLGKVKTDIFRAREALRKKLRLKFAEEAESISLGGQGA